MTPTEHRLHAIEARARRAYELGQLGVALRLGLAAAAATAFAMVGCGSPRGTLAIGGALFAAVMVLGWLGGASRRGAQLGLVAGLAAAALPIAGGASGLCLGASGQPLAMALCVAGGAIGGVLVGLRAARADAGRAVVLASAGFVALLAASLGCLFAGLGGIAGMCAAMIVAGAPAVVVTARKRGAS